ncbi:MAG: hypothetical protein V1856_00380 [Candidatus Liptonbacteria bacterium]
MDISKLSLRTAFSVFAILVAIVALILAFVFKEDSKEFQGTIISAGESSISVRGVFVGADGKVRGDPREVEVKIAPETNIVRHGFKIPSAEELALTGGMFKPAELPTVTETVDFARLRADAERETIGIIIRSSGNVYGRKSFTATSLEYKLPDR